MYGEVAYADLEKESVYDLTESNLVKMVRVMQLLLQHQQFQLEQGLGVQQQLMEEQVSTLGVLQMIPHLDIKDVGEGLNKLQGEFFKVADADMDAMFAQVRTEERTGARDTLANNVDQIKQVGALHGGGHQRIREFGFAFALPSPSPSWEGGGGSGKKQRLLFHRLCDSFAVFPCCASPYATRGLPLLRFPLCHPGPSLAALPPMPPGAFPCCASPYATRGLPLLRFPLCHPGPSLAALPPMPPGPSLAALPPMPPGAFPCCASPYATRGLPLLRFPLCHPGPSLAALPPMPPGAFPCCASPYATRGLPSHQVLDKRVFGGTQAPAGGTTSATATVAATAAESVPRAQRQPQPQQQRCPM
ncbi:hypothetical protein Vretifemale_8251 [Volvox reticuliferus]|uniref:Uncharacterized protein n=1 Tax=Volvox reticuliferus TaxID=1737510 RepID=A0A8J4CA56_9CHLO|nr:hypothetical protein Vretifemale_8251 [Volvox reticuliferus]